METSKERPVLWIANRCPDSLDVATTLLNPMPESVISFSMADGNKIELFSRGFSLLTSSCTIRPHYFDCLAGIQGENDNVLVFWEIESATGYGPVYGWFDPKGHRAVFCPADAAYRSALFFFLMYHEGYAWDKKGLVPKKELKMSKVSLRYAVFGLLGNRIDATDAAKGLGQFVWLFCRYYHQSNYHAVAQFQRDIVKVMCDVPLHISPFGEMAPMLVSELCVPLLGDREFQEDLLKAIIDPAIKIGCEVVMEKLQGLVKDNFSPPGPAVVAINNWQPSVF